MPLRWRRLLRGWVAARPLGSPWGHGGGGAAGVRHRVGGLAGEGGGGRGPLGALRVHERVLVLGVGG